MTDYTELVNALRGMDTGDSCPCEYCMMCEDSDCVLVQAAAAIEALQAQLPKRGEWIEENRRPRSSQFVCSVCHRTAYDPQPTRDKAWKKRCRYAYCPNCGAKMEEKC